MEAINTKIDNDPGTPGFLPASEHNQFSGEVQNAITDAGITLSSGDLTQLSKALAIYSGGGSSYTDSGSANAYVLTAIGSKKAPPAYFDGMQVKYITANPNTGASTVNVATRGVKNIRLPGGAAVAANQVSGRVKLIYDLGNDWFELQEAVTGYSLATNGYAFIRLTPTVEICVQWGRSSSLADNVSQTITLPIAFPTAGLSIMATPRVSSGTGSSQSASAILSSNTQIIVSNSGGGPSFEIYYLTVGY